MLEKKRKNFYTKSPMNLESFLIDSSINFGNVSLKDLTDALKSVEERARLNKPLSTRITKKEINIDERIKDIRKILEVRDKIEFLDLFTEYNKDFIIITFLSILTMSKNNEITLNQENNFSPILIERRHQE